MAELWPIHTVVFDLDDTLYAEKDYVYSGFAAVDEFLRAEHSAPGFESAARGLFDAGLRGRIFDEVLPGLGMAPDGDLIATLVTVYREHRPVLQLHADATTALSWCGGKVRIGLITDGYAVTQAQKVAALNLEAIIPHRILTDTLGRSAWKPSPIAFQRMMELCPGPASGFVYVGDNPRKDFLPGRELGWRTIRIRRPDSEHGSYTGEPAASAEVEIESLAGLADQLHPE